MAPSDILSGVERYERCLVDIEKSIRASRLCLNASKTNILWLESRHIIDDLSVHEGNVVLSTITTVAVYCLGICPNIKYYWKNGQCFKNTILYFFAF